MNRILHIILFILLSGLLSNSGKAQTQMPAKIEHYSTEDGLSHDVITTMFKDSDGYMWFGTWYGLNRFDGNHFSSFRSIANDSSQIGNNRIDRIDEDNTGHLWVKAYDGQIYRFTKKDERFRSLSIIIGLHQKVAFDRVLFARNDEMWVNVSNNGVIYVPQIRKAPTTYVWFRANADIKHRLPADKINFFFRASDGDIWLGTAKGLVRFTRTFNGGYELAPTHLTGPAMSFIAAGETNDRLFFITKEGVLWTYQKAQKQFASIQLSKSALNSLLISSDKSKLYVTTATGELITLHLKDQSIERFNSPDRSPLYNMFEDRHGNIWIEPDNKGVFKVDNRGAFKTYFQANDAKNINAGNHFKVLEDRNGVIWCVLRDGGFGYYDETTDAFRYFHNEPGAKDHAFSNLVTVAFYDPSGVMWLHTDEHGLEKIIFQPRDFENHLVNTSAIFQSDNEIRSLCVDRLNRVWICAKAGQIYWLQRGALTAARFSNLNGKKLGAVYVIKEDRNGNIWMGTKANGIFEAIPDDAVHSSYHLINFTHDDQNPNSISSNQIYAIKEDSKGRIWIGSFDHGLDLLAINKQATNFLHIDHEHYNYPQGLEKIRIIETDRHGRLWIGTTEGLVILSEANNNFTFRQYHKQPGVKQSLGNNDIQFIMADHLGRMWLATSGGGLDLATSDSQTGNISFSNYTTKEGLANDYVLSCAEDNAHQLWIATKGSLSRLDLQTRHIKNFTSYEGLPVAGFSESTCQNTRDGKLVFGTIKGYLIFDPNTIKPHAIRANLVLTNLRVNNEQISITDSSRILNESINYTPGITLHHNQNVLSVDYSLLDYRFDSHLPFMYRLVGFDNYWHDNANQLRATYTNIPAGHYTLEIKCVDPDRYSNVPYKSLAITVLPAPWLSWWAYLIYAAIIITVAVILWRNSLTALKLRHEIAVEHQLTELKLNFFTNISHELRTPLMLILNPIDELIKKHTNPQQERQYLDIIERNANRMVRFVNQLLDFRKIQSGKGKLTLSRFDLIVFIKDISIHFENIRREKQIDLVIESTEQSIFVCLDHDKIETIIYNLLSNAFKFTSDGKKITVNIDRDEEEEQIIIELVDQGLGVPEAELDNIFELYHSDERTVVKNSKGTGIGLALSKELVELHQGSIIAKNVPGGGLSVKMVMPFFDCEHIDDALRDHQPHINEQYGYVQPVDTGDQPQNAELPLLVLVEDNTDMREFLRIQLSELYRVQVAADGEEGLALVRSVLPDIVLSDVMMPKLDGIGLIDQLKNDDTTSHIPVVLMSARNAVEHQVEGLRYGADYYLCKPFKNELLLAAISNILEQRKKIFEKISAGKKVISLAPGDIVVTSKDEQFLKNVVTIIEENMADPDFDIDKVSSLVNMGRANFYKKFKSLTQIAPVEFVRDIRLQRARQYFDAGSGNVAEIAYIVGFSSPKYFSTCFRAKFNIAPSDYIKTFRAHIEEKPGQS
ncbi:two-component regulator propeller domain-containing protein [Mucilaginibacter sp. AW1-3]